MENDPLGYAPDRQRDAVRYITQVRFIQPDTMPLQSRLIEKLVQGQFLHGPLAVHGSCGNQ